MDLIGAPMFASDVALAGSATEAMYGMSESLYRPDMVRCAFLCCSLLRCSSLMHYACSLSLARARSQEPEELFEVISQCMLASVNRDALSGWGAQVIIMYVRRRSCARSCAPTAVIANLPHRV